VIVVFDYPTLAKVLTHTHNGDDIITRYTVSILHTNALILLRKILVVENLKKNANKLDGPISRIFNIKPGSAHLQRTPTVPLYYR